MRKRHVSVGVHVVLRKGRAPDGSTGAIITQYGSTVYIGMALVWPALI